MPLSRREQVAEILRANDVVLLEDDAYGQLEPKAVPLASLIPERTYFAASVSKCIAPGLCSAGDGADVGFSDGRAGRTMAS
jgi:DNA-binding transcriptional MocR family regulator